MTASGTNSAFVFDAAARFDTDIHGYVEVESLSLLTCRKESKTADIEAAIA